MTRLVLIRHGITRWNQEKRYCGHKDIGLSQKGKAQVKSLFGSIDPLKFDKVYCSDKKRARQTARMLFKNKKIILCKGLREISFGVLEGLKHEEIMEKHAYAYEKWLKDPFHNNIPQAEKMNEFKKRVENEIENIVRSNYGKTIAIVCHGGVIGIFVSGISKSRNFWRCVPLPASITMVEYKKGKPRLKKLNDTTHRKASDE